MPVKYSRETKGLANQSSRRTEVVLFYLTARLYPYGAKVGDALLRRSRSFSSLCLRINIPGQGLPFFIRQHNKVFVSNLLVY